MKRKLFSRKEDNSVFSSEEKNCENNNDFEAAELSGKKLKLIPLLLIVFAIAAAAVFLIIWLNRPAEKKDKTQKSISVSIEQSETDVKSEEKVIDVSEISFLDPVEQYREKLDIEDDNMIDAFGIYADNEFLGAVVSTNEARIVFQDNLKKYETEENIKAEYKKNISYKKGKYSITSLIDEDFIKEFLNKKSSVSHYIIEEGDSLNLVADNYGMTLDELLELNPTIYDPDFCCEGMDIIVELKEASMPVVISKTIEETSVIPFETKTVLDASMTSGQTEVIVNGEDGECVNTIKIYYEGDIETERKIVSSRITKDPVAAQVRTGSRIQNAVGRPSSDQTVLNGTGQFMWPVNGGWISDGFGGARRHKGMDIAAGTGISIYAAAAGRVIAAGWNTGGYGYFVMIDHGNGFSTLYGHMSKVIAVNGEYVECGDLIGEVGNTGDSDGSHCHFEIRYKNYCQNPAPYLRVNPTDPNVPPPITPTIPQPEVTTAVTEKTEPSVTQLTETETVQN